MNERDAGGDPDQDHNRRAAGHLRVGTFGLPVSVIVQFRRVCRRRIGKSVVVTAMVDDLTIRLPIHSEASEELPDNVG